MGMNNDFEDDWGEVDNSNMKTTSSSGIPTEDEIEFNSNEARQKELEIEMKKRMAEMQRRKAMEAQQNQRQQNINSQGQRVNPNGQRVNPNSQRVNPNSQRVNPNGQGRANNQSENLRQAMSKASSTVNNVTEKATEFTKDYSERIKNEYKADMSTDMKAKGTFGWSLYLYAVLAFGFFMFESSTALLLLAAWVIITEKNTQVNKMIISTLILYVAMKIGWSIFLGGYSFVYDMIPRKLLKLDISAIKDILSTIKRFISNIYDFAYIIIGLRGLLLAKKGSYYKLKFVEDLFD